MNENRKESHFELQLESQSNKKAKRSYRSVCLTLVAVLIIAIICMTGCKRRANDDEPTTSSEPVVTEESDTSEEPDMPEELDVSEEPEISEEAEASEEPEIDLSEYTAANGKTALDLINDLSYDEAKILIWSLEGAEAILSNGDYYTLEENNSLSLYYPDQIAEVTVEQEYVVIRHVNGGVIFELWTTGTDLELTINITSSEGAEETITVYITKEWG